MKKIFALLAVVLGVVSCQTEPEGLDVNVGGEQEVAVCVSLPEATRASDSAEGAFKNDVLDGENTLRYILQIYQKVMVNNEETWVASKETKFEYSDEQSVVFPVRLVPGRDYKFVVWADIVKGENAGDNYYITGAYNSNNEFITDLTKVTIDADKWNAMDEARDAYTGVERVNAYNSTSSINITLKRPFAKLRVLTTDMQALANLQIVPAQGKVIYNTEHYAKFNALTETAFDKTTARKTHEYAIENYEEGVLFVDYFFANNDVVKFYMDIMEASGARIKENNFSTDIHVQRNYLTTISGNILTDGNNVKVDIVEDGAFEGEKEWPEENNSSEQLAYAAMFGGEVTLTEDVALTEPLNIVEGANVVINLEGNTLTGAIELAEGAELTVNNGVIKNTDRTVSGITSNGDLTLNNVTIESARHGVRVESGNVVINGGVYKVVPISASTLHALNVGDDGTTASVVIKGGTFIGPKNTMADSGSAVNVRNGSSVVIEGGNFSGGKSKTLSGNITVKGGTFDQNPTNFVADGYKVIEKDGKYVVVSNEVDAVVTNKTDVQNALKDAATAGETEVVIDANGANINLDYGLNTTTVPDGTTVTIRNANVEGKSKNNYANGTVIFEGCTFNNASGPYSIHFDGGTGDVIFKNCKLYGWNSFARTLNSVSFENCTLDGNGIYALIRSYANLTLTNCVINTSNAIHNDSWPEGIEIIAPATLTENNVTYVAENPEALKDALANGENVVLTQDITTEAATTAPYGNKYAFKLDGGVIDGNGHELHMECYGDDYGIMTSGGTIKNVTIKEGCRAVMIMSPQTDVILDNVKIGGDGVLYPINTGEAGAEGVNLVVTNSVLAGWTSYSLIESATFTNVEFKQGTYYNNIYGRVLKPYVNTTLTNCSFVEHMNLDLSSLGMGHKIVMKNCTVNGQAVTAETFTVPTTDAQYDTELFTVDLPSWASSINDCVVFE